MDLSPDEGLKILSPHLDALYMFPRTAWHRYKEISPNFSTFFSTRTRSSVVHDLMLNEAASYAAKTDGIRWFSVNRLSGLIIDEQIAIRFKKLDSKKMPSNIPTYQVKKFRGQCNIPGIDVIHNLELGYCLDRSEIDIAATYLVYPSGLKSNAWQFEIAESREAPVIDELFKKRSGDTIQPSKIKLKGATIIPFSRNEAGDGNNDDKNKR